MTHFADTTLICKVHLTPWVSLLTIKINNTRQGYALWSTLKPAGYFFPGPA
jgi:hypothetical protein